MQVNCINGPMPLDKWQIITNVKYRQTLRNRQKATSRRKMLYNLFLKWFPYWNLKRLMKFRQLWNNFLKIWNTNT